MIFQVDSSGLIVEFPQGGVPWKDHLKDIEDTTGVMIAFVIYQDGSGMWRIQAVPVAPASFTSRLSSFIHLHHTYLIVTCYIVT